MKLPIYFDYSATTPVDKRVAEKMMQYMTTDGFYGNPASRSHKFGWQAEEAVDIARNQVADLINADPREIVFTSGATESDNLAIKGVANFYGKKGKHIITCKTEHKAVLDPCRELERQGFEVTAAPDGLGAEGELSRRGAGEGLAMLEHPHDLWLSALEVDGETLLGFGLAGCPASDSPLAAVSLDAGHELVVAVLELFLEHARPEQTRMRHLLQEVSVAQFLEWLDARLSQGLRVDQKITTWRRAPIAANAHIGVYPQRQPNFTSVGGVVPLGRLSPSMLRSAAKLADELGDGSLVMTPWQSLMLRNVRDEQASTAAAGLRAAGLLCDADQALSQMIACTGSAACGKGLADTKADALQLAACLQQQGITRAVHLSGCIRSCAAAHAAPITLLAISAGHYDLYFRHADQPGFGELRGRDLTIEAVGALLTADSRSSTDD